MSDKQTENIEPVDFDISQSALFSGKPGTPSRKKSPVLVYVSLSGLVLLALAVVFVLPGIVERYELPLEARSNVSEPAATSRPAAPPVNAVSPFDEAQRALQRKEAQDQLAGLLAAQAALTEAKVELWAREEYERGLEYARQGDDGYLQQKFVEARDSYQAGNEVLSRLVDSIPTIIDRYLEQGAAALAANNSAMALEYFDTALALEPQNASAQQGRARAATLDEVNRLVARGNDALEQGELESGRGLFQQGIALDRQHVAAQEGLARANRLIQEQRFAEIMSSGFAHLQNNDPQQAIDAFKRAASMGINNEQANAAITQTENEVARLAINGHREAALAAEQSEQWQDAVTAYDAALQVDSNLVFAQTGRDYADKRLRLDQLLVAAINNPERLADAAVYEQALDVFYTGQGIENPGPRLQQQLVELERALEYSQIPVTVQLVSDNVTRVSLLRTADLGTFQSHVLSLKPGRYVAVGTRQGYRDVRQEFVVGFGKTPEAVVVQCDEQVVSSRSR